MPLTRMKLNVGDKVTYQDARATVIALRGRKVMIRDQYGFQVPVKRSELSPHRD